MIKITLPGAWDFGMPQASFMKIASTGVDRQWMLKRATRPRPELRDISITPGHQPVHLIIIGATERYGCFAGSTTVDMASGGMTPIERVAIGDNVISASGNVETVETVFTRRVSGGLSLRVSGLPNDIRCTPDHPFIVARYEQFACGRGKSKRRLPPLVGAQNSRSRGNGCAVAGVGSCAKVETEEAEASSLRLGDFLVYRIPYVSAPTEVTPDEAYLMGAWLAEGCFEKHMGEVRDLRFSCGNKEGAFASRISNALKSVGFAASVYPEQKSCVVIRGERNPERARQWCEWFGEHAAGKRVPPWVLSLPRRVRLNLLAGYMDGNGTADSAGRMAAGLASSDLAAGIQRVIWSLGMPAARRNVPASAAAGFQHVSFPSWKLDELHGASLKWSARDPKRASKVHGFVADGYVHLPVRGLEEVDEPFGVYNIEVSNDHNYVVGGGASVKNCNKNGDGFRLQPLRDKVATFVKYAKHYHHHKNQDPKPVLEGGQAYGNVKAAFVNESMDRAEAVIEVNEKLCGEELEKLARGQQVGYSMACRVPFDVCSVCHNHATNRNGPGPSDNATEAELLKPTAGYCKHAREGLARVMENGHQIHVDNPDPTFFDVSYVENRPADMIAWGLEHLKAASIGGLVVSSSEIAEKMQVCLPPHLACILDTEKSAEMRRLLRKLADIEKRIEVGDSELLGAAGAVPDEGLVRPIIQIHINTPSSQPASLFESLADRGILLPMEDFFAAADKTPFGDGDRACADEAKLLMPGIFQDMVETDPQVLSELTGDSEPAPGNVRRAADGAKNDLSLFRSPAVRRVQITVIRGAKPTFGKAANDRSQASDLSREMARKYADYQLWFVDRACKKSGDDFPCTLTALANYLQ